MARAVWYVAVWGLFLWLAAQSWGWGWAVAAFLLAVITRGLAELCDEMGHR